MPENKKILITGGVKSGKTRYALDVVNRLDVEKKIYIATAVAFDKEMKQKIERHKKERDKSWFTVEAPLDLVSAIEEFKNKNNWAVVIDCFTMWINNMIYYGWKESKIFETFENTLKSIEEANCFIVAVTNEIGLGVIPESEITRKYLNYIGMFNQKSAKIFQRVVFMISGIPLVIKAQ